MTPLLSTLITFFLITVSCIGVVEGGYYLLDKMVLSRPGIVVAKSSAQQVVVNNQNNELVEKEDIKTDIDAILRRQLFGPPTDTNTEEKIEKSEPKPFVQTTLDVVLMGTIDGTDNSSRAIILNKQDNTQELYQIGDYIDDAMVKEIRRSKVILEVNGEEQVLDMIESYKYAPKQAPRPVAVSPSKRKTKALVMERTPKQQEALKRRLQQREIMMQPNTSGRQNQ